MTLSAPTKERAREALRSAPEDGEQLVRFAFAHPVLLRDDVDEVLGEAPPLVAETIEHIHAWLAAHPEEYPVGEGPIEAIWRDLDDGELSEEAALVRARHAAVTEGVNVPMVRALSSASLDLALSGRWRLALAHERVVVTAAEGRADAGIDLRADAVLGLLETAHAGLIEVPDRATLEEATAKGDAMAEELIEEGRQADAARLLFAIGTAWLDPYTTGRSTSTVEAADREWEQRGWEEHNVDGVPADPETWRMPPRAEGLAVAERYIRRALEIGGPHGRRSKALLQTLAWREAGGESIPAGEIARVGGEALEGLDPATDPEHWLATLQMLDAHGVAADLSQVDALVAASADEMVRRHGPAIAIEVHFQAALLLEDRDPSRALALLDRLRLLLAEFPAEGQRRAALDLTRRALSRRYGRRVTDDRPPNGVLAARDELVDATIHEDRDIADLAVALLCLAVFSPNWNEEEAGFAVLDQAVQIAPVFAAEHHELVTLTRARLHLGNAVNAVNAGELDVALERYAEAIRHFDTLDLDDDVSDCLNRVLDLAGAADTEAAAAVVVTLTSLALPLERRLGDRSTGVLALISQRLLRALAAGPLNPELLLFLLQLAKGHREAAALAGGLSAPPDDERMAALLAEIDALAGAPPPPPPIPLVAEAMLVSPYDSRPLTGRSAGERLVNLQRSFDDAHEAALLARVVRTTPVALGTEALQRSLDPRTVVAMLYAGVAPNGDRGLYTVLVWDEGIALGVSTDADLAGALLQVGEEPYTATITPDAFLVADLRTDLQYEDPGTAPATDGVRQGLGSMGDRLFGAVAGQLADLRRQGRDHLCVVPHGPYHFLPYALLGGSAISATGGDAASGCLADHWVTTVLPNLQLLLGRRGQPRVRVDRISPLTAVGLGFAGAEGGLAPLPDAVAEATQIGRSWGTAPLLDGAATKASVISALESSRYVHIATHGEHNVGAPSFQSLYVNPPERLYAHEVAALDLSALELVTLSACETALGKFDAGDNMRGLAPSLFLAGVQTVVATMWPAESTASRTFFTRFYDELHSDSSRLDAFAAAQAATRTAFPAYRDWGAFELLGAWW